MLSAQHSRFELCVQLHASHCTERLGFGVVAQFVAPVFSLKLLQHVWSEVCAWLPATPIFARQQQSSALFAQFPTPQFNFGIKKASFMNS